MKIKTEHKINLIKLMLSLPRAVKGVKFNMRNFIRQETGSIHSRLVEEVRSATGNVCGTTCCALGHGAIAGIGDFDHSRGWAWGDYSTRAFGVSSCEGRWGFLFHDSWPSIRTQAAARIQYYLLGGEINDYDEIDYEDQYEDVDRPYWRTELKRLEALRSLELERTAA